jgi:hypothetical protein
MVIDNGMLLEKNLNLLFLSFFFNIIPIPDEALNCSGGKDLGPGKIMKFLLEYRRKSSQIINYDICVPFYFLTIYVPKAIASVICYPCRQRLIWIGLKRQLCAIWP